MILTSRPRRWLPGSPSPSVKANMRALVVTMLCFVALVALSGCGIGSEQISPEQFNALIAQHRISTSPGHPLVIEDGLSTQTFEGYYLPPTPGAGQERAFHAALSLSANRDLEQRLSEAGISPNIRPNSPLVSGVILGILPIIVLVVIVCLIVFAMFRTARYLVLCP